MAIGPIFTCREIKVAFFDQQSERTFTKFVSNYLRSSSKSKMIIK